MSLEAKGYANPLPDEEQRSTLIVHGEDVVAHVHAVEYVSLFAHALEMRVLLENLSLRKCDKSGARHAPNCRACAASALLSDIDSAHWPALN